MIMSGQPAHQDANERVGALSPANAGHDNEFAQQAAATYLRLTGCEPADADTADDDSFDKHVLASILAVASAEKGIVTERVGLPADDLATLIERKFPRACNAIAAWCRTGKVADAAETEMVRDLLMAHRSTEGETGSWLATMVARRAMEPNHLWEDLGLRDRSELTRLLTRHFAPIAVRNTNNMRWKRFFYRSVCENEGLLMCSTPVCSQCGDFEICFSDESGESRMAYQRRALALKVASLPEPGEIVPPRALP
jgi:nitrogen fixation protein NifQ